MMNGTELALQLLPRRCLDRHCREMLTGAEEIRLRIGQAPMILQNGREYPLHGEAVTEEELMRTLEKATGASLHTAAAALARGFISYHGLRIGVCGTAYQREDKVIGFRSFSSLAIRIPRECKGICHELYARLRKEQPDQLLILSPPGMGKTTVLRELIRCFSCDGLRIGVVDERWEIAASEQGRAQFDLGAHSDVLSGVPKAIAAMMLLRTMNPQIIAMDEITQPEDLDAIREIIGCGVRLIATAHAAGPEELGKRPLYRTMLEERLFEACIRISMQDGERRYELQRLPS